MNEVVANYSFDISQENGGYRYMVTPTPYGKNLAIKLAFILGFFLAFPIIGIADMKGATGLGIFIWILVTWGVVWGILKVVNTVIRKPSEFFISKDKIEVKGKSYDRKHVSNLFIKHPKDGIQDYGSGGGTFIVAGSSVGSVVAANMMASSVQLNREISASLHRSIDKYRYMLYFAFGETKVKLASGMSESSSKLLFDKIIANHS